MDPMSFKLRANVMTGKGEISIGAVIYSMSPSLYLVELHRRRGDILEFNHLYNRLRELIVDMVVPLSKAASLPKLAAAGTK